MSDVTSVSLSPYAKFFMKFKGKNFIKNNEIVPKFMVWYESANEIMLLLNEEYDSADKLKTLLEKKFLVQDKPGWKNGGIIDREVAHTYYYEGLAGVKEKHSQKNEKWAKMNLKNN